ncbi:hypothetical protein ACFHW2_21340 [Actinomadura sp. LOL_016]|uniref:hypothetical protein n=1 Tax=unclassified Actinomadura TaxID=2626254 RepID=UPI003A812808
MAEYPGFGVLVARLSGHRDLDVDALARLAGVEESELQAVYDGAAPSPAQVRALAPALGFHVADMFVIADMGVPDELAPLDAGARTRVSQLVGLAVRLSPDRRRRLFQLVAALPQEDRTQPVPPPRAHEQYQPGLGALFLRMLGNRNLGWLGAAKTLAHLTNGHVYLAASMIGMVGHGRKELTPDLVTGFAIVLGIPADDLAAMTGIELGGVTMPHNPAAADVAELIWNVRRLKADQVRQLCDEAESMRQE